MHCDADAFYVGCELARRPELRDKPVVVAGKLGSCILAKSYDLKRAGVKTAMPTWEVKKKHPEITILEADFQYYSEVSAQMFSVLGKWTPDIEVYSIDEAFMDMKGFRKLYKMSYPKIAYAIKEEVKNHLGLTVSIGVSVNKTLAKMAAEVNKPDGVTSVSWRDIPSWLQKFKIEDVPGIGRNTTPMLNKLGVHTCADFTNLTFDTVKRILHKPGLQLWKELQGEKVFRVEKTFAPNKMITRTSSFTPLTDHQGFLWSHTLRQLERAIEAMNDSHQMTREVTLYIRDKEFKRYHNTFRLPNSTRSFQVLVEVLKKLWKKHFPKGVLIRSTGIILTHLSQNTGSQLNLFEDPGLIIRKDQLEESKQGIKDRYGNLSIRSASSLRLKNLGPDRKKAIRAKTFNVDW